MKKNILPLLMSLLFLMTADAQAQEWCAEDSCCYEDSCCVDGKNFYARIMGGVNFLQDTKITSNRASYRAGNVIAVSLGYCWRSCLRMEAEYGYRRNPISKIDFFVEGSSRHGHYQASSWMANLIWDVPLSSCGCAFGEIQPFIGGGVGYDFQQMRSSNCRLIFKQNWNHFSWQLMAGVGYPIFCNTKLTLEYTFHQGGSHFNNHSLGVGLVYKFGL